MRTSLMPAILLLLLAAPAGANSFDSDGTVFEPAHDYSFRGDRDLLNDGSFEQGTCIETPVWTCTADNDCDWIADLVPLGLWNYDGIHIAWLGGYCGGIATSYSSICQTVELSFGCGPTLSWMWMAYVNDGGCTITVSIDGEVYFSYITDVADHLLDYQTHSIFAPISGEHEVCFNYELGPNGGDNYFVDYVQTAYGITATELLSLSAVKSLY